MDHYSLIPLLSRDSASVNMYMTTSLVEDFPYITNQTRVGIPDLRREFDTPKPPTSLPTCVVLG